jgi:hypothetical protein
MIAGYEITVVIHFIIIMMGSNFYDTPPIPVNMKPCFGETQRLHLQNRKLCQARNEIVICA